MTFLFRPPDAQKESQNVAEWDDGKDEPDPRVSVAKDEELSPLVKILQKKIDVRPLLSVALRTKQLGNKLWPYLTAITLHRQFMPCICWRQQKISSIGFFWSLTFIENSNSISPDYLSI